MLDLPVFPEFKKLESSDISWYKDFYAQFPPYADFSFGNYVIWLNQNDDLSFSSLYGNLVLSCTNWYMRNRHMISLLGDNDLHESIDAIFQYQRDHNMKQELLGIPEFMAQQLMTEPAYNITEDRDNAEYIIDAKLLGDLQGGSMGRIRQDVHAYVRRADEMEAPIVVKELDLDDQENINFLSSEVNSWELAFSTNDTAEQERSVIMRTLESVPLTGHKNISIFVGNELAGFALYHVVHDNTAIISHLKTSYKYRHTSYFAIHTIAKILNAQGIEKLNIEQDLGIPGLRIFKMKLKPLTLLRKFDITPAAVLDYNQEPDPTDFAALEPEY